jgi:molybdate transport system substrate-binding protein
MAHPQAPIRVFCGAAPKEALRNLSPEFERATGARVEFTFELVSEIQRRLAAGERADAILLPVPLLAATEKTISLRAEGRIIVARVGIGIIVHQSAALPDISTVEAVRKLLLEARAIAWPDPRTPIGSHLNQAIAHLGIADALRPKLVVKAAIHGGAELVSRGEADLGLYLVSEVQLLKGTTVVGLLPPELQYFVVYGAAVPSFNENSEAALAFLEFISASRNSERWRTAGFELVDSHPYEHGNPPAAR